jgi:pimeloyl-ACP methyl ester carboxylesterase
LLAPGLARPHAGHFVAAEQPDALWQAIRSAGARRKAA